MRCNRPLCHGCSTFSCPQIYLFIWGSNLGLSFSRASLWRFSGPRWQPRPWNTFLSKTKCIPNFFPNGVWDREVTPNSFFAKSNYVFCDRKVTWELPLVGLEPTRLLTSVPKTDTSTIPPQRLKYWISNIMFFIFREKMSLQKTNFFLGAAH